MIFESKTPEYYEWVQSLQYLDNKEDFMNEESTIIKNWLVTIIPQIEQDKYHYHIHPEWIYLMIFFAEDHHRIIYNYDYGINKNAVIHKLFDSKQSTSYFLKLWWIKTLNEIVAYYSDSKYYNPLTHNKDYILQETTKNIWFPCIIKPSNGSFWEWVKKVFSSDELSTYIDDFNTNKMYYIIQQFYSAKDYRIIYLDWEVIAAYQRVYPTIIWDGFSTIWELIQHTKAYELDSDSVISYLTCSWLLLSNILEKNQSIQILPTANIATGWTIQQDVIITQEDINMLNKIVSITWARYFWVDILTNDSISNWYVLELNRSPWIDWIWSINPSIQNNLSSKIRQAIKQSEGIIE